MAKGGNKIGDRYLHRFNERIRKQLAAIDKVPFVPQPFERTEVVPSQIQLFADNL